MRKVARSALVPYTASEMFALVDDVEAYPRFLPWCDEARVESRSDDVLVATLGVHLGPLHKRFTTRNTRRGVEAIEMELVGGPFRHLQGGWRFRELAEGCEVSLELEFEFENRLTNRMFGMLFEQTVNSLVDAFARRARELYGPRIPS